MDRGTADSECNDGIGSLLGSSDDSQDHVSNTLPVSNGLADLELRRVALSPPPRRPVSDGPRLIASQQAAIESNAPHKQGNSNPHRIWDNQSTDEPPEDSDLLTFSPEDTRSPTLSPEDTRSPTLSPEDARSPPLSAAGPGLPTLSRDELTEEILQYLQHSVLKAVYGDCLSGSRRRRYEPQWPMEFRDIDPPLDQPLSQEEANFEFHQLFQPLGDWYKPSKSVNTFQDAHSRQKQIAAALSVHSHNRATQPPVEKRSGNFLLYRNLPDAAMEVNIWSFINTTHVAIRRKEWQLADDRLSRAFLLASKLGYQPLVGKCWYWRGMIADGCGDRKTAADCFLQAMPCVGFYQEGEMLSKVVVEYKHDLLEMLDEQDEYKRGDQWSERLRRAILGGDGWSKPLQNLPRRTSNSSPVRTLQELLAKYEPQGILTTPQDTSPDADPEGMVTTHQNVSPKFDPQGIVTTPQGISPDIDPQITVNNPQELSRKADPQEVTNPTDVSPKLQPSPKAEIDDVSNQPNRKGGSPWWADAPVRPRDVDWTLVQQMEEAAEKFEYVPKQTIYQLCKGFSPSFEDSILAEPFTEKFDNYPGIKGSIAWKVLMYAKTKGRLRWPPDNDRAPQSGSEGTADDLTEACAHPLSDSSKENNDAVVDKPSGGGPNALHRGPRLKIDTGRPNVPAIPCQTSGVVMRQSGRVDITDEERIAAYEQALINQEDDGKTNARREVENNVDWRNDIREQQANFDRHVHQEMAKSKMGALSAMHTVRFRNEGYLNDLYGPEAIRPPTPSPTRKEREEHRKELRKQGLERFKAEQICMNYGRKLRAYQRLPIDRQERVAEPIRPSSTFAWLEQHKEMIRARRDSRLRETARILGDMTASEPPVITRDSSSGNGCVKSDQQGRISSSSPLHLHLQPEQASHHKSADDRSANGNSSGSSIWSIPSNVSSNTYANLNRRRYEHIARELKALISVDSMSEAMEQARLNDKEVSLEELVQIAETAVSETANGEVHDAEHMPYWPADDEEVEVVSDNHTAKSPAPAASDETRKPPKIIRSPNINPDSADAGPAEDDWVDDDEDKEVAATLHSNSPARGRKTTRADLMGPDSNPNKDTRTTTQGNRPTPAPSGLMDHFIDGFEHQDQAVADRADPHNDEGADNDWEDTDEKVNKEEEDEENEGVVQGSTERMRPSTEQRQSIRHLPPPDLPEEDLMTFESP